MKVYYNENDEQKAAWLRELIRQNIVAPGEVDERSIEEVQVEDLRGFRQCHFFAGIGVWSYAVRLARWPDDRPVWTGSCPCPSFSAAGKGGGFDDPRHLWPAWYRLIPESSPATIFGEQADDAIGYGWLDLVQTDLERAHYAVGKAVLGACSVGAPHIRQRCYFVAHQLGSKSTGRGCPSGRTGEAVSGKEARGTAERSGLLGLGPNSNGGFPINGNLQRSGEQRLLAQDGCACECWQCKRGTHCHRCDWLGNTDINWTPRKSGTDNDTERNGRRTSRDDDREHERIVPYSDGQPLFGSQPLSQRLEGHFGDVRDWRGPGWLDPHTARSVAAAGATRGFWADCDWWHARDEKYRPIECGLFPLATGATNRVLKLRGYGDAIVAPLAAEFIKASWAALNFTEV